MKGTSLAGQQAEESEILSEIPSERYRARYRASYSVRSRVRDTDPVRSTGIQLPIRTAVTAVWWCPVLFGVCLFCPCFSLNFASSSMRGKRIARAHHFERSLRMVHSGRSLRSPNTHFAANLLIKISDFFNLQKYKFYYKLYCEFFISNFNINFIRNFKVKNLNEI